MRHQSAADHQHLLFAAGEIAADALAEIFEPGKIKINLLQILVERCMEGCPAAGDPTEKKVFFRRQVMEEPSPLQSLDDSQSNDILRAPGFNALVIELDAPARHLSLL